MFVLIETIFRAQNPCLIVVTKLCSIFIVLKELQEFAEYFESKHSLSEMKKSRKTHNTAQICF